MNLGRTGRRGLTALTLVAVATMVIAAPAQAGPAHFTYELCDSAIPGGDPPAIEFHANPGVADDPFQTCASPGGGIGVSEVGQVADSPGWMEVAVLGTPGGFVEGETITAFASDLQPGNEGSHVYADGWPSDEQTTARYFHIRSEAQILSTGGGFTIALDCSASPCEPGGTIGARDIAVQEVDPVPPVVKKVEGPLLAGGVLRGSPGAAPPKRPTSAAG